jgi:hypothetical protein
MVSERASCCSASSRCRRGGGAATRRRGGATIGGGRAARGGKVGDGAAAAAWRRRAAGGARGARLAGESLAAAGDAAPVGPAARRADDEMAAMGGEADPALGTPAARDLGWAPLAGGSSKLCSAYGGSGGCLSTLRGMLCKNCSVEGA